MHLTDTIKTASSAGKSKAQCRAGYLPGMLAHNHLDAGVFDDGWIEFVFLQIALKPNTCGGFNLQASRLHCDSDTGSSSFSDLLSLGFRCSRFWTGKIRSNDGGPNSSSLRRQKQNARIHGLWNSGDPASRPQ